MLETAPTPPGEVATLSPMRPTAVADGSEVCGVDAELLPRAVVVRDWLLAKGAHLPDQGALLAGLAKGLNDLGLTIDRITTAIEALHSQYSGVGRYWTKEEGASYRLFPHGPEVDALYERSPFAYVSRTGKWLQLDLDETPDEMFGVIPELRQAGYRHYLCIPIAFTNGTSNCITFATRSPKGFGTRDLGILRFVLPTFAAICEMRTINQRLDNVLRIYVGDEPHRAILSGAIQRGQVSRIRSAILFADMRNFTRLSSSLSPEGTVDLLNGFFDCLVPPIEDQGGEVLKYMGDGLLAIFRDVGDDTGAASQSALTAAKQILGRVEDGNGEGRFPVPIAMGIALHHGEAAYGNVGSGARLDFTVIGRDVNLASRIAELNKRLGEPLLLSKTFVEHLWGDPENLGAHAVEGFDERIVVYRPPSRRSERAPVRS